MQGPFTIEANNDNKHQSQSGFQHEVRDLGINPEQFECAHVLNANDIFYAFHQNTPDWIITLFQQTFDELKEQGRIKEIFTNEPKALTNQ